MNKREEIKQIKENMRRTDWGFVMSDARGRRVIAEILNKADTLKSNKNTESLLLAQHEGRRQVGIHIMGTILKLFPEKYLQMFNESVSQDRQIEEMLKKEKEKERGNVY